MKAVDEKIEYNPDQDNLISPKNAARMLDCSRTQVDRTAQAFGWKVIPLSKKKGGGVRYRLADVLRHVRGRNQAE